MATLREWMPLLLVIAACIVLTNTEVGQALATLFEERP
jgi:hypothetical protein